MFDNARADLQVAREGGHGQGWWRRYRWSHNLRALTNLGVIAVLTYRWSHWTKGVRVPLLGTLLRACAWLWGHLVTAWTGVYISPDAVIGPGLVIHTLYGINVGTVRIGAHCTLSSGVLISCGTRSVGDNVFFGAGSKVVGDTRIGNNVVIMPNSLVLTDVADNTTVVGVPARIKLRGGQPQRFPPAIAPNGRKGSRAGARETSLKPVSPRTAAKE